MSSFFSAAGATGLSKNSKIVNHRYEAKFYDGSKTISEKYKSKFPKPIKKEDLYDFLLNNIDDSKALYLSSQFEINEYHDCDLEYLLKAICEQFNLIIMSSDKENNSNYPNIINGTFDKLKNGQTNVAVHSLYKNDVLVVTIFPNKTINLSNYESTSLKWHIENRGNVDIVNRKLIILNKELPIIFSKNEISIKKLCSNNCIDLTVDIETRGIEGLFKAEWIMVDEKNENCYPNNPNLFNININISFLNAKDD